VTSVVVVVVVGADDDVAADDDAFAVVFFFGVTQFVLVGLSSEAVMVTIFLSILLSPSSFNFIVHV
jgi:hypothetical protein